MECQTGALNKPVCPPVNAYMGARRSHSLQPGLAVSAQGLQSILPRLSTSAMAIPEEIMELKISADQGNVDAQIALARHLRQGELIPKDLSGAAKYYKMAADQGHAIAMNMFGFCLKNGEGVAKNLLEAMR
jgi:TPR repeat protein